MTGRCCETEWVTEMRIRWAARRAEAAGGSGGDGGAWLDGDAARGHGLRRGDHPGRHRRHRPQRPG